MSCCGTKDVMMLACSGGCNVGQIANDAARTLDSLGQGRMFCAIGIASDFPGFVEIARKAAFRVVIDGCESHCIKNALDKAGLSTDAHVVVTELGIEKTHRFDYSYEEVARAGDAITKAVTLR